MHYPGPIRSNWVLYPPVRRWSVWCLEVCPYEVDLQDLVLQSLLPPVVRQKVAAVVVQSLQVDLVALVVVVVVVVVQRLQCLLLQLGHLYEACHGHQSLH